MPKPIVLPLVIGLLTGLLFLAAPNPSVAIDRPAGPSDAWLASSPSTPKDGSVLIRAIRSGEVDQARGLLSADPVLANSRGKRLKMSPLHWAAVEGEVEIATLLLIHDAKVSATAPGGVTALHLAAFWDRDELAALLVANGADVKARSTSGLTPLHLAAQGGSVRVATLLIAKGGLVNRPDGSGRTPLCYSRNAEVALLLIKAGAAVNARRGANMRTPLHDAVVARNAGLVAELLANDAEPNVRDSQGITPLHEARDLAIVEQLLAKGAAVDPISTQLRQTPLHRVTDPTVARLLLANKANPNRRDRLGRTPLHRAAGHGRSGVVAALLEGGADPNLLDAYGSTPLFSAVEATCGSVQRRPAGKMHPRMQDRWYPTLSPARLEKTIAVLIAHGADLDRPNRNGWSPLHLAVFRRSTIVAKILLTAGAGPNMRDRSNYTPLHQARTLEMAKLLLEAGADVNAKGNSGLTPLWLAMSVQDVADLMLEEGADVDTKDRGGYSLLHRTVLTNNPLMFGKLVARGADLSVKGPRGLTPVEIATQRWGAAKVTALLGLRNPANPTNPANRR